MSQSDFALYGNSKQTVVRNQKMKRDEEGLTDCGSKTPRYGNCRIERDAQYNDI